MPAPITATPMGFVIEHSCVWETDRVEPDRME